MAVSSLLLGLSSHQPANHTYVKSPRSEKKGATKSLTLVLRNLHNSCEEQRIVHAWKWFSTCAPRTFQYHGHINVSRMCLSVSCTPGVSTYNGSAFLLSPSHVCVGLKKPSSSHLIFAGSPKKTFRTCADEHTRLEQCLPVQTPHIKRHTF